MSEDVQDLTLDEARAEAEEALSAGDAFRVARGGDGSAASTTRVGPGLLEFFARYPEVQSPRGGWSREEIHEPEWAPGYLHLAEVDEHLHLMARPGEDAVLEFADDVPLSEAAEVEYPSIYHWIVCEARREALHEAHAAER